MRERIRDYLTTVLAFLTIVLAGGAAVLIWNQAVERSPLSPEEWCGAYADGVYTVVADELGLPSRADWDHLVAQCVDLDLPAQPHYYRTDAG